MEAGGSRGKGETSLDAWESRKLAAGTGAGTEKYKNEYFAATFADAISIYLLSLFIDVDYYDLRERDYPLLAPAQMAERLRKVAELFPANPGFEFAILLQAQNLVLRAATEFHDSVSSMLISV